MAKLQVTTELERALYAALKEIGDYTEAADLMKHSETLYGLDGWEALEMAYDNVIQTAKDAIRGVTG